MTLTVLHNFPIPTAVKPPFRGHPGTRASVPYIEVELLIIYPPKKGSSELLSFGKKSLSLNDVQYLKKGHIVKAVVIVISVHLIFGISRILSD